MPNLKEDHKTTKTTRLHLHHCNSQHELKLKQPICSNLQNLINKMLQDSEIFEWVLIKHPQKNLQQQQQQNAVPKIGKNVNVNIYIFGFIQI
jgi:hypothetical protein